MKINRRFKKGLLGSLAGFLGPALGFCIYYLFFGYYINSWIDVIVFTITCLIVSLITVIILKKSVFKI